MKPLQPQGEGDVCPQRGDDELSISCKQTELYLSDGDGDDDNTMMTMMVMTMMMMSRAQIQIDPALQVSDGDYDHDHCDDESSISCKRPSFISLMAMVTTELLSAYISGNILPSFPNLKSLAW